MLTLFNLVFLLVWNGETRHECPAPLRILKAKTRAFLTESTNQVVHIKWHTGFMWRWERRKLTANGSSAASFDCIFIMNTGNIECSDCKCDVAVFASLGDRTQSTENVSLSQYQNSNYTAEIILCNYSSSKTWILFVAGSVWFLARGLMRIIT